jgi:putative transcriptional regulator
MIIINVDVMLAKRKMTVTELAERLEFTLPNVSMLKTGKIKALKMTTLDKLCDALDCQPGDILEFQKGEKGDE